MTIAEKTPLERAAMRFKAAGLGDQSSWRAARMLFETGISFESAAVLGRREGEASTATPASIREAADAYRRSTRGDAERTAWGREIRESVERQSIASKGTGRPAATEEQKRPPGKAPGSGRVALGVVYIDGVAYQRVEEYEPVQAGAGEDVAEEHVGPPRSAWGRPLSEKGGADA